MTVYVDVLVFINMFVNFFILRLSAAICRKEMKVLRTLFSSFIGALFSLYIFLPVSDIFSQTAIKLITSAVVVITAFKFRNIRSYLRNIAVFFSASFLYAGFMMAVWYLLKPQNILVNNGVVYFDVSPVVLIGVTLITYMALSLIRIFSGRNAPMAKNCTLEITINEKTVMSNAIIDTGNSLTDCLDGDSVVVIDNKTAEKLFDTVPSLDIITSENKNFRFRPVPYSTIGGGGLMPGFKPDKISAYINGSSVDVGRVTIAISNDKLSDGYSAIIGPDNLGQEIHKPVIRRFLSIKKEKKV